MCIRDRLKTIFAEVTPISYQVLVRSNGTVSCDRPDLCWIDLPHGRLWRAEKVGSLEAHLQPLLERADGSQTPSLVMVRQIPSKDDSGLSSDLAFPHKRWARLLSKWRPITTQFCMCKFGWDKHTRLRVFSKGLPLKDSVCGTPLKLSLIHI